MKTLWKKRNPHWFWEHSSSLSKTKMIERYKSSSCPKGLEPFTRHHSVMSSSHSLHGRPLRDFPSIVEKILCVWSVYYRSFPRYDRTVLVSFSWCLHFVSCERHECGLKIRKIHLDKILREEQKICLWSTIFQSIISALLKSVKIFSSIHSREKMSV